MPNGFISADNTGLQDYAATSTNTGYTDTNQNLLDPIRGISAQLAFAANDNVGLTDYIATSTNTGYTDANQNLLDPIGGISAQRGFNVAPGIRQPNLRRVVRWT